MEDKTRARRQKKSHTLDGGEKGGKFFICADFCACSLHSSSQSRKEEKVFSSLSLRSDGRVFGFVAIFKVSAFLLL
jgi:hypothetical protein